MNPLQDTRILIMEDDANLRRLFAKALRAANYHIEEASTLDEANSLLTKERFHLWLCDLNMNGATSLNLLKRVHDPITRNGTRVIIISGENQFQPATDDLGIDFFLQKPISIGTLVDLVQRLSASC